MPDLWAEIVENITTEDYSGTETVNGAGVVTSKTGPYYDPSVSEEGTPSPVVLTTTSGDAITISQDPSPPSGANPEFGTALSGYFTVSTTYNPSDYSQISNVNNKVFYLNASLGSEEVSDNLPSSPTVTQYPDGHGGAFAYTSSFWVDLGSTQPDNSAKIAALQAQVSADQQQLNSLYSQHNALLRQQKSDENIIVDARQGYLEAHTASNLSAIKDLLIGAFGFIGGPGSGKFADLIDFVATSYSNGGVTDEAISEFVTKTTGKSLGDLGAEGAADFNVIADNAVAINRLASVIDGATNAYADLYTGDAAQMMAQFESEYKDAVSDIKSVNAQLAENQSQIGDLRADIASLQDQISVLEAQDDDNWDSTNVGLSSHISSNGVTAAPSFEFTANQNQLLSDFQLSGDSHSTINLPASDFTNLAAVLRNAHNTANGVTIVDPANGGTVQIAGVTKAELKANKQDFAFV